MAALASRLIARRAASFRAQNGFRLMRKTNVALCRLHECNVRQELEDLLAMLPAYRASGAGALDLPMRDNLDYVLLRVRQLACLLQRITRCAREASELFLFYVHRRYFLETAVVHVAVLADVWLLAHRLCVSTVQFYDALQPYARHFGGRRDWLRALTLPAGGPPNATTTTEVEQSLLSVLPARLADCLGDEWLEECRRAQQGIKRAAMPLEEGSQASSDAMLFGFSNNSADADQDIVMNVPATDAKVAVTMVKKPPKVQIAVKSDPLAAPQSARPPTLLAGQAAAACDDIGVAIPRQTPNAAANGAGQGKKPKAALPLDKLVNADDVQAFMRAERSAGGSCGAMAPDRWKELQRKCNHILVTTQGRNTVRAFRQFWTQSVLMNKAGSKAMR